MWVRSASLALLFLAGCGARSELFVGTDGEAARLDAGRRDAGPDAGRRDAGRADAGVLPPCGPGSPRVLATEASYELEIDDRFVYYSTGSFGGSMVQYRRVPKCGGAPETLIEGRLLGEFFVSGEHLYFSSDVGLERMRTDGSERTVLFRPDGFSASPITVTDTHVLFSYPAGRPTRTRAVPIGGGPVMDVAPYGGFQITADSTSVYMATWDPAMTIASVPISGGPLVRLGRVRETIRDIAVDATHVYWADSADAAEAEIFRAPIDGSSPDEVVFRGPGLPIRLAIGERFVYFNDHTGGRVVRVPLAGGPLEVLDDDVPVAEDLAIDDESIFTMSFRTGELLKIARPD